MKEPRDIHVGYTIGVKRDGTGPISVGVVYIGILTAIPSPLRRIYLNKELALFDRDKLREQAAIFDKSVEIDVYEIRFRRVSGLPFVAPNQVGYF